MSNYYIHVEGTHFTGQLDDRLEDVLVRQDLGEADSASRYSNIEYLSNARNLLLSIINNWFSEFIDEGDHVSAEIESGTAGRIVTVRCGDHVDLEYSIRQEPSEAAKAKFYIHGQGHIHNSIGDLDAAIKGTESAELEDVQEQLYQIARNWLDHDTTRFSVTMVLSGRGEGLRLEVFETEKTAPSSERGTAVSYTINRL